MNNFLINPVTIEELLMWKRCTWRNPRSKRSMKNTRYDYTRTKLYLYLYRNYHEKFPNGYDIFDSIDEKDPITLEYFYSSNNGQLKLEYHDIEDLIIYPEIDSRNNKLIRCIKKDSLSYLKNYNITKHPVSQIEITEEVLNLVEEKKGIEETELSIKDKSLQVFQIFNNISIFIDFNLYLQLSKQNLCKLNYELKDFYYQNLSSEQRVVIDKNDGEKLFKLDTNDLENEDIEFIQFYILNQIEPVIKCDHEEIKLMANYLVLGGLSLVIDEVKESYENFAFSF